MFIRPIRRSWTLKALFVSHLLAADRLRRHPDMWEERLHSLSVAEGICVIHSNFTLVTYI